jgi:hypothetical protein
MPKMLFETTSILLHSGRYLNLANPDPLDIFAADIAIGLARECRWGNHSKRFYSVVEHSVECMNLAERWYPGNDLLALECLLHDASEAFLKDIPSPLKKMISGYYEIEGRVMKAIFARFGMSYPYAFPQEVDRIDRHVLGEEWDKKVLKWTGLELDEKSRVDIFIHHMIRLCKIPVAIQP